MTYAVICAIVTVWTLSFSLCICVHVLLYVCMFAVLFYISAIEVFFDE